MLTPGQLDRELGERLAGARLVCEVDLPEDLLLEVKKAWHFNSRPKGGFVREYPAIGAFFLVDWGANHYKDNEYWPGLKLGGPEQNRVGEAFEAALRVLGLETFPQLRTDERARRFVAPILAHGGIPGSLAQGFLTEVLYPAVRRSPGSTGADLVARWRRQRPPYLPTTVARFLLYGGKAAVDLVDRLIGLASVPRAELEAGAEAGVPRHLVRAYLAVPPDQVPPPRRTLPRPVIELDPWGDAGPVLRLPQLVRDDGKDLAWTIEDGSGVAKVEPGYSRRDDRPIPLLPADEWAVTAHRNGNLVFERTYECFGDNRMLCFDDARVYLPDVEGIKGDFAWVVTERDVALAALEAEGCRTLSGETTTFVGPWSRHRAVRLDLTAVDVLIALRGGDEIGRVQILRTGAGQARFTEPPLRDVRSRDGLEVRASLPSLVLPAHATWRIRITGPDGTFTRAETVGDLPMTLRLDDVAPDAGMGTWDVSATQALGFDFTASFALVPGLRVETPPDPLPPASGDSVVSASSTDRSLRFPGRQPGEAYTVTVPAGETRAEVWVYSREHDRKVGLLVTVPRIQWAFRGAVVPELGDKVLSFEPEDLGPTLPALLVAVGRGDVPVRVLLEDAEGERLLLAGAGRTSPEGAYRIELGGLRDTARACADRGLRLTLVAGDASVLVGFHLPAQPGQRSARGGEPSVFERDFELEVYQIMPHALLAAGDGWEGIAYENRLPRPLASYRVGDMINARVTKIEREYHLLDARVFDPTAFVLGETVEGVVAKVDNTRILVSARGHELIVDEQRLPSDRPPRTWRVGDAISGKVVSINPLMRKIRMSVAPFEPGGLKPGDLVEGRVFFSRDVVFALVNGCVGHIRNGDKPASPLREGDTVNARVLRVDHKRDQIELTCRPFNSAGLSAGAQVKAEVTGIHDREAWVRVPGGEPAMMLLEDGLEQDYIGGQGVGAKVDVIIESVDRARSRITARLADGPVIAAYIAHDGPESPFAKLAGFGRR